MTVRCGQFRYFIVADGTWEGGFSCHAGHLRAVTLREPALRHELIIIIVSTKGAGRTTMYLKNKDTSVFEDDELFAIYDSIMLMCQQWFSSLKEFEIKHPKSAKLKSQSSWSKKYKESCFLVERKEKRIIDEDLCKEVFTKLMDY